MTVWVVHPVTQALEAALQYGELRYINEQYVYADELVSGGPLPDSFLNGMRRVVDQFRPDGDYLLIVGDHLQLIQMTALLVFEFESFRVLRFDRLAQGYFPVTIGV